MWVRLGSVPPIITGLPSLRTSGAIACTWVERIEPRNPTMSGCAASFENASTIPGLVVWSSSMTSSTCLPSTPPALLTAASASFAPFCAQSPCSAAGPVTGTHMPILMVAACARALPITQGALIPTANPAVKSRRVSFIHSSCEANLSVGLLKFLTLSEKPPACLWRASERVNWPGHQFRVSRSAQTISRMGSYAAYSRCHANLRSLEFGLGISANNLQPRQAALERMQHILQLGEFAHAITPRDRGIDGFR